MGKRRREASRDRSESSAGQRSRSSTPRRQRRAPFDPEPQATGASPEPQAIEASSEPQAIDTSNLCDECSNICWDSIEEIANERLRMNTWTGRRVVDVGRRFRRLDPNSTCTLCRQLHAPWIEKFLEDRRWIERKCIEDVGDRIHVFPNLRHVHHISDFQSGRNALRIHEAPYHIAVVPIAPKWRTELKKHLDSRGLVVVLPDGRQESRILQPQPIPEKFDRRKVLSWLKTCKGHRNRCNPKPPEVNGMRLIDCKSDDLAIRDYELGNKYVALSYVWGESGSTGPAAAPRGSSRRNVMKLPEDLPLTIRDAIEVTKALRYRYLWVDKYCIDQNNPAEQREQFSRMGDIYAGAQVAIFALGDDSNAGLPGVSSTPRLGQQECRSGSFRFISTMPDPHEAIKQTKWMTRAWTYQEGLFSTRRLFFIEHQVYFECNAMNEAESFKSNLDVIHTQNGQRFRAYHRAGQFVCGNSTPFSHLDVRQNKANHRKIDMLHRCQHQTAQYTRRELTNKNDVLNAFAAIARFYAKTTAMIASLAGIPIPFPIANLPSSNRQEGLDHLSYALAWSHKANNFDGQFPRRYQPTSSPSTGNSRLKQLLWNPNTNPKAQHRRGFPSWSWAGWFGEIRSRDDLPYCWTSLLSSPVQIGVANGELKDYHELVHQRVSQYKQYRIREMLAAESLHFDAYVLNPHELRGASRRLHDVDLWISLGPTSWDELNERLMSGKYQAVVLGTYGEPRPNVYRAIQAADKKRETSKKRRIDLFERSEPNVIVCLIVRTDRETGVSFRRGLLKVRYYHEGGENALRGWNTGSKKSFVLR